MKTYKPATAIRLHTIINISAIVSIHYFEFDKNYHFPGESHNYWEMVYVDSGKVIVTAEDRTYTLEQGDIIFHKPNEFHTISADKKTASNVCVTSFVTASPAMHRLREMKTTLPSDLKPFINTVIKEGRKTFDLPFFDPYMRMLQFSKTPPLGGLQLIKSALEQLFIYLIRIEDKKSAENVPTTPEKTSENKVTNDVISLLRENVYGKISVEEICKRLNYSKTYISKVFNESLGKTIIAYYTDLKIKEAKKLIRERAYSITEISNMLYFSDPHYFSRVFKKATNMSPREYLNSVTIYTK